MATDFSHLLDVDAESVKRPPAKPPGTYHATIAGFSFDKSAKKGTPFCRFQFTGCQPGEDVDTSMLKDEDGVPLDLSKWKPTRDFYITEDALWRLTEFLENLGIPRTGRKIKEMLPETRNLPVILTVSMKATEDGQSFFNNVDDVKAA